MKQFIIFSFAFISFSLFFTSCGMSESDIIGKEFNMSDGFHVIEFKAGGRYHIYQKPANCGGDGSWSISDGKVKLESNNSNCESTQNITGTYDVSDFK
jgi:hypothetical protein